MEAIHSPFSSLPIPSSLASQSAQKGRIHVPVFTKQRHHHPLVSLSQFRTRALEAADIAADISASPRGDISVLIPVSAVLLFMYWISNFVVADMVSKDLQKNASEAEEKPEQHTNTFDSRNDGAGATSEPPSQPPQQKLKKAELKKMIKQR